MKFLFTGGVAILLAVQLAGCARTTQVAAAPAGAVGRGSSPVSSGLKSPSQVQPCCRALAEGRISLDQCMQNPQCVANNRSCCMNAIQ